MNDLAEKALHGLDVVRRAVAARPVPALAGTGLLVGGAVAVLAARIGAAPAAVPLTRWFGLQPHAGYRVTGLVAGFALLAAIAALTALWVSTLHVVRTRALGEHQVWTIAVAWLAPFVLGPPLLSTDAYSYVARGLLARAGLSAYHHGPSALGGVDIVTAIDPNWRSAQSTDGPLMTALEHLLVTAAGGSALAATILLRVVAVVSVLAIGRLAADLAGPRRSAAVAMTVLNPAVLLYVVSGLHTEGVLAALLLACLVRAGQRRWTAAVVLACLAAGIKPVALIAVPVVLIAHAVGSRRQVAWRILARDAAVAALTLVACSLTVPYGFGWTGNLDSVTLEHTAFAPASLVSDLVSLIVPAAAYDDLAVGGRIAVGLAAVTIVTYLLVTVRDRPLERTMGYALLAAGLLGPVLYPWYLLWGLLCLAPTVQRARRDWVIALSLAACVLAPVGFARRSADIVTICWLAVLGILLAARLLTRRRAVRSAGEPVSVLA